MGFVSHIVSFFSSLTGFAPPEPPITPQKRRGDDIISSESKVRRVEDSNLYGERYSRKSSQQTNERESNFLPRNQVKLNDVQILSWGQNGKENDVQYLPPFNSVNSLTMGHCLKSDMDEIQVLEDHNQSSNISKRGRNNLNLVDSSCYDTVNRNGSGADIVEVSPPPQSSFSKEVEIINIVQPSPARREENDVLILKDISASKQGQGHKEIPFARKPFKTISPAMQASSTPISFTTPRVLGHSPEGPEVEILQLPRLTNGVDSCQYRSQSSILSSDSSSSRKNSTLLHMKRAEDNERYAELLKKYGDKIYPQQIKTTDDSRYLNTVDREASNPRASHLYRSHLSSAMDDRVPKRLSLSSIVKDAAPCERINVSVERIDNNEPSTSATRHQSEDADLQYLGQVLTPVAKIDCGNIVEEIMEKYNKLNQERKREVEIELKKCKLVEEHNRLAALDRQRKVINEISRNINAFMKIKEEPEIEEEEEKIPQLPELTDEMNAEINKALASPPDAVLASAFNITIKGRDMRTLRDLAWLNDEVINFYMNMIIERGKADNYPPVHAFNTFFFPKLISSGYDTLKRWTKKVDIFAHDYLLVPVHRGMHWCMAIIDMKQKVIRYYDSMNGRFPQCMDALLNYLQKESLDKKKQPFDTTGWVKEHAQDIPQQNNGSDCGMFACMYAEYISRGATITFSQENMPYFRRKAVYEILKAKLLC